MNQAASVTPVNAPSIIVAASSTGGHLFPAAFIIRALREVMPGVDVQFIGTGRALEARIIGPLGVSQSAIEVVGVKNRGIRGAIEFLRRFPKAWRDCRAIFKMHTPAAVVGVGGYVTVLPVIMARLRGVPSWIHEAERTPGLANWLLCFFANRVSVAFEDARLPLPQKKVVTGQPVRPEILSLSDEPLGNFPPFRLLVMGGSQGARPIDDLCVELSPWFAERGIEILHQARGESVQRLKEAYRVAGVTARVVEFIDDIADAYRWAHLVLARSGAGTVMELGVVNRPVIFMPYPHAQANHQYVNARVLADRGKALIVEEGPDALSRLKIALQVLTTPEAYEAMRKLPLVDRGRSAARQIAEGVLKMMQSAG